MATTVKRAYWWLPMKPDGSPYQGAPGGGWNWISEPGALGLGPGYSELKLPSWLPQQVFIVHAYQGYGCSTGGQGCEVISFIDPGGKSYGSTHPPGQEFNMDRNITLIDEYDQIVPYQKFADSGEFATPVLWDRAAGDRLVAEYATNPALDWVYLQVQFLVTVTANIPTIAAGY